MGLMDYLAPIGRIAAALESIADSQRRIADVHEGKLPPPIEVPEAPPPPAEYAHATTDRDFARIEMIEARFLALNGRLPSADEVCRELDGEEIPQEVVVEAMAQHMRTRGGQI